MRKLNEGLELSSDQINKLLQLGFRPLSAKEPPRGDMVGGYMLIPTKKLWRELEPHAYTEAGAGWEGSYIPLIIYKGNQAAILVGWNELKKDPYWKDMADRLTKALGIIVVPRGD